MMNLFTLCRFTFFIGVILPTITVGQTDKKQSDPPPLIQLREGYERAVDRALAPLDERYLEHLRKLQNQFTQRNALDSAIRVRSEIELLKQKIDARKNSGLAPAIEKKPKEEELYDFLQEHELSWQGNSGSVLIQFNGKKLTVLADGLEIMEKDYRITGPLVFEFDWNKGEPNVFTFDRRKRNFTRKSATSGITSTGEVSKRPKTKSNTE